MRQIKFRGLRTDANGFAFGLLRNQRQRDVTQFGNGVAYTGEWEYWIDSHEGEQGSWLVIPESVGQSTGKFTKSGTEIFDGDKLQQTKDSYWVVKWSDSNCGWNCYQYVFSKDADEGYSWKKSDTYPLGHSLIGLITYNYEVVGNTHTQDGEKEE